MDALNAAQRMQMIEKFETLTIKEYRVLVYENEQLRQRITDLEAERDGEAEDYAQRAERSNGMIALQLWLQNHNRKMTQDAIDEALMEYISHVEQQRDELLAAAEAIEIDAEECLDFDECTAMLVSIDAYHGLMEAIASVNEK